MLFAGCRLEFSPPAPGEAFPSQSESAANSSHLAPGDTLALLNIMQANMRSIDSALAGMTQVDSTFPDTSAKEPRQVSLWLEGSTPRKLLVTEPNESGLMTERSSYWFIDGELRVAVRPLDGFFLEGDRILLWTDGTLEPHRDVTSESRMTEEMALVAEVNEWLRRMGVALQ